MKKLLLFMCLTTIAGNAFSQKQKAIKLRTEVDTVSYAYGASIAEQGLMQHLIESGVLSDTASIRNSFEAKISEETDRVKIEKLKKDLSVKLDSANRENKKNIKDVISGIQAVISADKTKKAYSEGLTIGTQLARMMPMLEDQMYNNEKNINKDIFLNAIENALQGSPLLIENGYDIINNKMKANQAINDAKKEKELKAQSGSYIQEGERFMQENRTKEGVITLENGLQYKIVTEGNGPKPSIEDKVKVHYRGSLINGTVFDSSIERGEPAVLGLKQVIRGWTEILQLMPVGSKWIVYIPYEMGYGARQTGSIPAYSNLVFEIELLDIEK